MDMEDCFNTMYEAVDAREPMELSKDEQRAFERMYDMMRDMQIMMEEVTEMEEELKEIG